MKRLLILSFLLLCCFPVAAQEERDRNYQIELSGGTWGFLLKEYALAYHIGAGLNFPANKPGWYNNFSLTLSRNGQFLENYEDYYTLTAGKHRQWTKGHFYSSLGLNAGVYFAYPGFDQNYYRWINTGLALTPRGELGWRNERLTVCYGMHLSIGAGYYRNPEMEALNNQNGVPPKGLQDWFGMSGTLCPYVKVIF